MAKAQVSPDYSRRNPTIEELARMPDYRRNFLLRYWRGGDRPSDDDVANAVAQAVQEEFETISGRVVNRFVYFIQADTGLIKIGVASNVKKRLGQLRGASPVPLTLLLAVPAGAIFEYNMHHKFRQFRVHGEWFSPASELLAEIERLSSLPPTPAQ